MKSKILTIAAVILLSIGFSACQDEEISPINSGETSHNGSVIVEEEGF